MPGTTSHLGLGLNLNASSTAAQTATNTPSINVTRSPAPSYSVSHAELQTAWTRFRTEKPVKDEDVLPAEIPLKIEGKGQSRVDGRDIWWEVDDHGLRSVRYEISGIFGTLRGGLKDQDDADGNPETLFHYVDSEGAGFQWKRKGVHDVDSKVPRPHYMEYTGVRAVTDDYPEGFQAISGVSGDGWSSYAVPVKSADVHQLLGTALSELPATAPDDGKWQRVTKEDVEYQYRKNAHGTTGSFIGPDRTGNWVFHGSDTGVRSLNVSCAFLGGSKFGFGLLKKPGEAAVSNGWFLPEP